MNLPPIALAGLALALAAATAPATAQQVSAAQAADPYFRDGEAALAQALRLKPRTGRARNVILFVGDGMGISTVTAARIFEGQSRGVDGESNVLAFERLPYVALSKTYSVDAQVTDSAAGINALATGVKTRNGVLGLTGAAAPKDCAAVAATSVATLAELAKRRGLATGVVTTTRLTHATPAGFYAHIPDRDWEGDGDIAAGEGVGCTDIARQLVEAPADIRLDVALGGGSRRFLPASAGGRRRDGRDLTREWLARSGPRSAYVATAEELAAATAAGADHLLGLFGPENLPYEADRAKQGAGVPTLSQMTAAALHVLAKSPRGYVLLVEGGRIDHGSHENKAYKTLSETAEFARAVQVALDRVDLDDTLIVVTADHSHGLVINGYPPRNNPILGLAADGPAPADGKARTTLTFATGPGGAADGVRRDPATEITDDPDYREGAGVPMSDAAHTGEDVAVFAGGPQAHLLHGVVEQSYIFQVMRHALGLDRPDRGKR